METQNIAVEEEVRSVLAVETLVTQMMENEEKLGLIRDYSPS